MTFQSGLRFQTSLSLLRVSCKSAHRQASIACTDYFEIIFKKKNSSLKMEVLLIFSSWDQEIVPESWIANP